MAKTPLAPPPIWNYDKLMEGLGPDREIQRLIVAAGFAPPPLKTIAGWRHRRSIPAKWSPILMQEAERRGLKSIEVLKLKRRTVPFNPAWKDL